MALRWLNSTPVATAAAVDAGLSGIQHFWTQVRFKGSYLLDMPRANGSTIRFGFYNTATPAAIPPVTELRYEFGMRKREPAQDSLEITIRGAFDAETLRSFTVGIPLTVVDALVASEFYTIYIQAWTDDTTQNPIYLYDDAGTELHTESAVDGAPVLPLGDFTLFVAGLGVSNLCELDAFAIGSGVLPLADRYVSPATHASATRYWLFEDGSGSSVVEGSGGGQTLSISGVEDTDYEWFTGDWGAAGGLAIDQATLPNGAVGAAYSQTLTASDGTAPYTWSVFSGSLPDGLALNASTGAITGTPTTEGAPAFTIRVTDDVAATDDQAFTLTIDPEPGLTPAVISEVSKTDTEVVIGITSYDATAASHNLYRSTSATPIDPTLATDRLAVDIDPDVNYTDSTVTEDTTYYYTLASYPAV